MGDVHGKENGRDKKMKKNLAMGRRKSVGMKQIRMCHGGEIKQKKKSATAGNAITARLLGHGLLLRRTEGGCRLEGKAWR